MSCTKTAYFSGWGTCQKLLQKMSGGVLQTKGNTWTDATIIAAASWHTAIADDDSSVRDTLPFPILNFENTTDEMEILTSSLGHKFKGSDPVPSGKIFLKVGADDYTWMHDLDGQTFEFIPFFQGNQFWASRKADGTLKGFRCSVAFVGGLPPEDKLASYPMHIFFDDPEEFKNVVVVSPDNWRFSDLLNYVPVGLNIREYTAYTGGQVRVLVTKTGNGDPMTGLVAGDFEVMSSNATPTVAVTALTEEGLGYYLLTIKKDNDGTPANLAASDYVILQAHDVDSGPTYLTYLSHAIQIYGGT